MERLLGFIYQYIALIAVVALLTIGFFQTGEFNEMLLGALIGVMVQIPVGEAKKQS